MSDQLENTETTATEEAQTTTAEGGEQETQDEADTFPREYVVKLREENAENRAKARDALAAQESLQTRLHLALVSASGKLADPTDLPFDAAHLESDEALAAAINALIERKPHLASRRVVGDVGQGAGQDKNNAAVDLGGMLRAAV